MREFEKMWNTFFWWKIAFVEKYRLYRFSICKISQNYQNSTQKCSKNEEKKKPKENLIINILD